jgi:hypothetical protein
MPPCQAMLTGQVLKKVDLIGYTRLERLEVIKLQL